MDNITISYMTMRKAIGILALAFPIILILSGLLGGFGIQDSFSAYYWTNSISVFVGMLITFGIFLLSYKGYDKMDEVITTITGIAMILVALFPMQGEGSHYLFSFIPIEVVDVMHYIFAGITFILLGVMSYFQFTKSGDKELTPEKKKRNLIYKICGVIIVASILASVVFPLFGISIIFLSETIVMIAFGISWLIKGETLLKDKA